MEKDSIQRFLGITIIVIKAYGLYHRAIFSKINSGFTTTIYPKSVIRKSFLSFSNDRH